MEITDFFAFLTRFNELKRKWFSPDARPKYDDEGQEMPSALNQDTLTTMFKNMGLQPPRERKEGPFFIDPEAQKNFDAWRKSWEQENNLRMFDDGKKL